jgi:hypothetical protein
VRLLRIRLGQTPAACRLVGLKTRRLLLDASAANGTLLSELLLRTVCLSKPRLFRRGNPRLYYMPSHVRTGVSMFLMFQLQRQDVLPVGDLGIRRAVMLRYGIEAMPSPAEVERIAEPWRPHRTLASLYLWRSLAAAPL